MTGLGRRAAGAILAAFLAGACGVAPGPIVTAPGSGATSATGQSSAPAGGQPVPTASPAAPAPAPTAATGARVHVEMEGASGCPNGFFCTARLSVLPDAAQLGVAPGWTPAPADAMWQTWGVAALSAPPQADLPTLAVGAHLAVWSLSSQRIATDPPTEPPVLAARCTVRVVVAPTTTEVTIRVRFASAGPSAAGNGVGPCTLRAVLSDSTPAATAGPIAGQAALPGAALPTGWREVHPGTPVSGAVAPGSRIQLGVAPDGAFIAVASSKGPAVVLRSVDGGQWSVAGQLPQSAGASIMTIAGDGRAIVAAGWTENPDRPAVWTSSDGLTWKRLASAVADGLRNVSSVVAGSDGFVAMGDGAGAAPWITRDPAVEWFHVGSRVGSQEAGMSAVAAARGGFVGVGWAMGTLPPGPQPSNTIQLDARAWRSTDGRTWIPNEVAGGEGRPLRAVAAQGSRVVAFSDPAWPEQGTVVFVSADGGRAWARSAGPAPDSSCCQLLALRDGWLAATTTVWTAADGASWSDAAWRGGVGPIDAGFRGIALAANDRSVVAVMASETAAPRFFVASSP